MPSDLHVLSSPDQEGRNRRIADWVLHSADWLVTCDGTMSCLQDGALAIEGSIIAGVGSTAHIRRQFSGIRELDMSGFLLAPGLVNSHVHGAMTCFRGLADDLPLEKWLFEVIFPAEAAHVSPDLVYWGTLLATAEMLTSGTTTFCDGYFFEEAAVEAALQSGMRAVLGQGILDLPSPDQPDPTQYRERAQAFLDAFPTANDRVRPSLFCHAPYTCGGETLKWVKGLCRDKGMLFQIHLSEIEKEVRDIREKYGLLPVEYLDNLGVLDELTLCAHGIWVTPEESHLLARRGTGIAHDVGSNMKLAAGIAPIPRFLSQGVKVGLGTDSCASNNDLDLFGEMDLAAKLHKVHSKSPEACPAVEILRMATRGGAQVLGLLDQTGSLEMGKKADIIAIDLHAPHLIPLYDPISHMVYCIRGSDVRHVWVNGHRTVSSGRITTFDEEEARDLVAAMARKIKPLPGIRARPI